MTLYRQLLVLLWTTLLISLVAVVTVNFRSSSSSLQEQLQSNTENALTSLGMSVAPHLQPLEETLVEVTLNAAFDGAFYRRMRIEMYQVDKVLERENLANPKGVPDWFINLFPFAPVVAEAPVTTGWTESALITIEGHPGFIQQQLWALATQLLAVYGTLFLVVALFCSWALRVLTRPLQHIEKQAKAVEARDFSYQIPLPTTRELKQVVLAMNHLMTTLQERFTSHAKQLEQMRVRLQQDSETGIVTRQHFVNELDASIVDHEARRALIMVRLLDAEKIRKRFGYSVWITLLKTTINLIHDTFEDEDVLIGRMSEAELAVLCPAVPGGDIRTKLAMLQSKLCGMREADIAPLDAIFLLAGTPVRTTDSKASVLTRCDNQLSELAMKGANLIQWSEEDGASPMRTGQAWVALLRGAIEQQKLMLETQGVFTELGGSPLQHEVYVRLLDEQGEPMPAGAFMPVIEQYDLGVALDLAVLERVIAQPHTTAHVINVSLSSMQDTAFVSRLSSLSAEHQAQIIIEISEVQLKRARKVVEGFVQILTSLAIRFGFDSVGATSISLDYVSELKPAYLKIAPGLCRAADNDSLMLVTGICNTVHNLAIPAYATAVEDKTQLERLLETGVDGFQGYITKA